MADTESPPAQSGDSLIALEESRRFSESILWRLQRAYFAREGLGAWRDGTVPYYITNNPYIARRYAQVVYGWLRDLLRTPGDFDFTQPFYVLELGAGSGQLGYHFSRQFTQLLADSALGPILFRYVLTDFNAATLDDWQAHPQLAQLVAAGQLDFARFDATQDQSVQLIHSQTVLVEGKLANPIVVLANYVFDSVPEDVFRFEKGQLFESLVRAMAHPPATDFDDPELLKRTVLAYRHRPAQLPIYPEPEFNEILGYYQKTLQQSCLPFPVTSLRCLQLLRKLSGDRMMVISGDKGFHREQDLDFQGEPGLTIHGSFSMSVNLHALGHYTTQVGGTFLATQHQRLNLDICTFLFGRSGNDYAETRLAFAEAIERSGPDDFFVVKKYLETHFAAMELAELLAFYRLSSWDSAIFVASFIELLKKLPKASDDLKLETYAAVREIWDGYYYLGEDKDVPFALGLVLMGIENYGEAINFFEASLGMHGPDASTFYYLAACHAEARQLDQALAYTRESLALNPQFEPAQKLQAQIQAASAR